MSEFMGDDYSSGNGHCIFISYDSDAKPFLAVEPEVEHLTKEDILEFHKDFLKNKPKQFPVGEYRYVMCDNCDWGGVLLKKQLICPMCHLESLDEMEKTDIDQVCLDKISRWLDEKKEIDKILSGNFLIEFVKNYNESKEKLETVNEDLKDKLIGDEVIVDEGI